MEWDATVIQVLGRGYTNHILPQSVVVLVVPMEGSVVQDKNMITALLARNFMVVSMGIFILLSSMALEGVIICRSLGVVVEELCSLTGSIRSTWMTPT